MVPALTGYASGAGITEAASTKAALSEHPRGDVGPQETSVVLFETDAAARRPAIVSRSSRGHLKVTEAVGETPPPKPVELSAGLGPLC